MITVLSGYTNQDTDQSCITTAHPWEVSCGALIMSPYKIYEENSGMFKTEKPTILQRLNIIPFFCQGSIRHLLLYG
jgi:hypothetical protein